MLLLETGSLFREVPSLSAFDLAIESEKQITEMWWKLFQKGALHHVHTTFRKTCSFGRVWQSTYYFNTITPFKNFL